MNGVCVQIGLFLTAEYAYLADETWRGRMKYQPRLLQLPKQIYEKMDTWSYFGVDECPTSTAHLGVLHWGDCRWVTASIGVGHHISQVNTRFTPENNGKVYAVQIPLHALFKELGLSVVDVLAMDVEGMELMIFEHFDWKIKPRYITVEVHSFPEFIDNYDKLLPLIEKQGYSINEITPTNINSPTPTTEVSFILNEN